MNLKICSLLFFLVLLSCNNLDFVYKDNINLTNPVYKKTSINLSGINIPSFYGLALRYLGQDKEKIYRLTIDINEEKIKRSVESNQAVSKLDYNLTFAYELVNIEKNCLVFEKDIPSSFTFEPRSSGYNFGSDQSLKDLYETAGKYNLQQFIGYISNTNLTNCVNET